MCYNTKKSKKHNSNYDQYNGYNAFLEPADVLSLYSQSLVTFAFNVKKRLAENPDDWIIAYENRYGKKNKSMTFKIQHDDNIIGNRILKYNNIINNNDDTNNTQKTEIKDNDALKLRQIDNMELYQTPILLVDDNIDLLYTFELLLKSEGYGNVKSFSDPKEVLKYFTDISKFKLAVLDITMPDINGIQLYQMLKILNPSIKILFMTALDAANKITGMMVDVNQQDIMRKPLGRSQFIEKVTNKIRELS